MTLQDSVRVLRERWLSLALAIGLGLLAAGAVWYVRPREYTAELTLYVSAATGENAASTDAAYQGSLLSQQRVTSYVELLSSAQVADGVIQELGLRESPGEVARRITAASSEDSVLIGVEVVGNSPEQAVAVAEAIQTVFPRLVENLEKPPGPASVAPVSVRVVPPIAAPTGPSSTGLPLTLAIGLLAGAVVGVSLAFLRDAVDTSVTSPEDLSAAAQAANLGVFSHSAGMAKHPLPVLEDPRSPMAEAFRQLRTNLQFVDVDRPHKVIVVTSSVASEGKTTLTCNLAVAMAAAGAKVILIEADLRNPQAADLLGFDGSVGLTSVLTGQVSKEHAVQRWHGGGFDLLATGPLPPNPSEVLASHNMRNLLARLRVEYDVVLVDSPPLLPVTDAAVLAAAADGAILVCRFKKTRKEQVRAAVRTLDAVSARLMGTVLTMVPTRGPQARRHDAYYGGRAAPDPKAHPGAGPSAKALPSDRPADEGRAHASLFAEASAPTAPQGSTKRPTPRPRPRPDADADHPRGRE